MKSLLLSVVLFLFSFFNESRAQNPDLSCTNNAMQIPRVALTSTTDVVTVASAPAGFMVYNTATVNNVVPGYYRWNGNSWEQRSADMLKLVSDAGMVFKENRPDLLPTVADVPKPAGDNSGPQKTTTKAPAGSSTVSPVYTPKTQIPEKEKK